MLKESKELKYYRSAVKEMLKQPVERDEEGRLVVAVSVDDESLLYDAFCTPSELLISEELSDHLCQAIAFHPKDEVCIRFERGECEVEEAPLRQAIDQSFRNKLMQTLRSYSHNMTLATIFAVIGVILMALSVTVNILNWQAEVFSGILTVASWSFLGVAIDKFCFELPLTSIQLNQYKRLLRATIVINGCYKHNL